MSSFANNQQNHAQELSPEALARKLEKNRLLKLRQKENKRLKKAAAASENDSAPASAVNGNGNQGKGSARTDAEGSSSSDMVKNILGIKPGSAKGKRG